jgi:thiol:disulfide interchange protein DsbD
MRSWLMGFALRGVALFSMLWANCPHAAESETVRSDHLSVQLVSSQAQAVAGSTTWVGLRLEHEPEWHTYWINPGDSGLGTKLAWRLPRGVIAGDIDWPAPHRIEVGTLTNFGYDGEMLLPVRVTLPAGLAIGTSVLLEVKASWLVCKEECIPGEAVLKLQLPIAGSAIRDQRWDSLFAAAQAAKPETVTWHAQWADAGDDIDVLIQDQGTITELSTLELFPQAGTLITHGRGVAARLADGRLRVRTPKSDSFMPAAAGIPFLLASGSDSRRRVLALEVQPGAALGASTAAGSAAPPSNSGTPLTLLLAMLFALLGGILLNLMPCVLPVLSLKALALAEHSHDQHQSRRHGVLYCAGTLVCFVGLAGVLLVLRSAGQALGWGFQLQTPWVVASLAMLMTVMGLSLSGMFELGSNWMGIGQRLTEGGNGRGAFFSGVLAAVVASPCTAPFMGPALGFAILQPAPVALGIFAALGIGLSLPILALSFLPALGRWLPRPGAWMQRFKQLMAYPLYITAVWLLWVLGRQSGADGMALVLLGTLALVFGLSLWGSGRAGLSVRAGAVVAIIGAGASMVALSHLPGTANSSSEGAARAGQAWQQWSPDALQELRAEGKPVLVNMTAAWCITCLANERVALSSDLVQRQLRELNITYLKGDWTQRDARITEYLSQFGRNGVPLYVLYPRAQGTPEVLPQVLTPSIVAAALQRAAAVDQVAFRNDVSDPPQSPGRK